MQGKITKVLNMKPMEILSMMEEAAGTRMFEERKEKALKTIFKKEKRLEEIQTLLQEELLPKLDKLRSEKTTYLEYQSTLQSKEKLERQVVLIEYKKLKALAQESAQSLKVYEEDLSRMEINIQLHQEKLSNIETKVSEMLSSKNDADLSQLEAQAATLNRELSKLETRFSLKLRAVEEEKLHLNTLLSSIQQLKQSIKHQEQQTQTLSLSIETLESLKLDKQREVDRTKEMLVSLSLNQSSDSFDEQIKEQSALLVQLQAEHNNLATKLKAIKLEQGNLVPEIEKMKLSNQKIENEMQTAKEDLMKKEKNLSTIKMQLESLSIEEIHSKLKSTTVNYNQCQEELDILSAQVAHAVRFDYHDPTPNFDRTLVKGPVASLITIEKSNFEKSSAIEITAGGKLYNVIVENEKVGSQLLQKGRLQKRVTLIPLNKIQPFVIHKEKIELARSISSGNAELAVNLVKYPLHLKSAIDYVFAGTFICKDAQVANKVTFHQHIKSRSVTWAGDTYDPSGVLSGGSKPQSSGLLVKLSQLQSLQSEISILKKSIEKLHDDQNSYQNLQNRYNHLVGEFEIAKRKTKLIQERLQESNDVTLINRLQSVEEQLVTYQHRLDDIQQRRIRTQEALDTLKNEKKSFSSNATQQTVFLKTKLETLNIELIQCTKKYRNLKIELDTQMLELEHAKKTLENFNLELETSRTQFKATESELEEDKVQKENCQSAYIKIQSQLEIEKNKRAVLDRELQAFKKQRRKLTSELQEWELERQSIQTQFEQVQTESKGALSKVMQLETTYSYLIHAQQELASLDIVPSNLNDLQRKLANLTKRNNDLKRNVNLHVMEMLGLAEKKESELKYRLQTVLKDKHKIEGTIKKLDEIKEEALKRTWIQVNQDFGQIFSDLLPGNTAKLEPVDNKILLGLEVRVRLGQVWKSSLTELSGGQRSLIALALILSFLQFKPAPMYILDEVDAALDLSHTQNIGQLIKTRFTGSQFIIVSLKEGMFTNAHVIFRTKFRDGTSSVDRIRNNRQNSS